MELKPGDDLSVDPFEAKSENRKERLSKQKRQEERNRLEAAHAAGLTSRGAGAGVSGLRMSDKQDYLKQAIAATQVSTASVGRFDRQLENEPSKNRGKRQQYESATERGGQQKDSKRMEAVASHLFPDNKAGAQIELDKAAKVSRQEEESSNRKSKVARAKGVLRASLAAAVAKIEVAKAAAKVAVK